MKNRKQTRKINFNNTKLTVTEYPDGQSVLYVPSAIYSPDLDGLLEKIYQGRIINVQDEGHRYRIDIIPMAETAESKYIMLAIPKHLRFAVIAALGAQATALEKSSPSTDSSIEARKIGNDNDLTARSLRALVAKLLLSDKS